MLGLLVSGKVAVGDLEANRDITLQKNAFKTFCDTNTRGGDYNKQQSNSAAGGLGLIPNLTIQQRDNLKSKTNSFMSMINDYKHKIREDMNATSTLAADDRKSNQDTSSLKDKNTTTDAKGVDPVQCARKPQPTSTATRPPIKRVDSESDSDSFLKEPPMYYVGMARSAAASFFAKTTSASCAENAKAKTSTSQVQEVSSNKERPEAPIKSPVEQSSETCIYSASQVKALETTLPKKDQVLDAMEFVEKAKNSAISLFSRSDDLDEVRHGVKEDTNHSATKILVKKDNAEEAMDIVDRAKNAAVSLFSKSKRQASVLESDSVDSHTFPDEDVEDNDIVVVQTSRPSTSLDLYSSSLFLNSNSSLPRSRAASYDQLHQTTSSLRKSSTDSTYVTVPDMYSYASEDDFIDYGFVPQKQETIEEEASTLESPSTPPKVRRNSVDTGDLAKSKSDLEHQETGLFARAAFSILPSRSQSDKDGANSEKDRISFSSFLSSITSKRSDEDDRTCDTMETPKKKSFASGKNEAEPFLRSFSPKFVSFLNSRQSSAPQKTSESLLSPGEVLEKLEAYVNAIQDADGAEKLISEMNAIFDNKLNGNAEYWETLSTYYAVRPSLVKYTVEKELHRMDYVVLVRSEDSTAELTSTEEICNFLRTHKQQQCEGKMDESTAVVDYLFRVANQSLLADPVEMLLKGDAVGPNVVRSVRVRDAKFTINTIDGCVRCDADLRVFLPLSDAPKEHDDDAPKEHDNGAPKEHDNGAPKEHANDEDDISISSASTASTLQTLSSFTCSEVELSRLSISATFSLGLLDDGTKSHTAGNLDVVLNELKLSDKWTSNRSQFEAQLRNAARTISEATTE